VLTGLSQLALSGSGAGPLDTHYAFLPLGGKEFMVTCTCQRMILPSPGPIHNHLFQARIGNLQRLVSSGSHKDKPDLLVIDDMGLKQLPKRSGEYLFEIIMRRYENGLTTWTAIAACEHVRLDLLIELDAQLVPPASDKAAVACQAGYGAAPIVSCDKGHLACDLGRNGCSLKADRRPLYGVSHDASVGLMLRATDELITRPSADSRSTTAVNREHAPKSEAERASRRKAYSSS
jgi:hypothetical protein